MAGRKEINLVRPKGKKYSPLREIIIVIPGILIKARRLDPGITGIFLA